MRLGSHIHTGEIGSGSLVVAVPGGIPGACAHASASYSCYNDQGKDVFHFHVTYVSMLGR
jgi:protein-disulfide isomerase